MIELRLRVMAERVPGQQGEPAYFDVIDPPFHFMRIGESLTRDEWHEAKRRIARAGFVFDVYRNAFVRRSTKGGARNG